MKSLNEIIKEEFERSDDETPLEEIHDRAVCKYCSQKIGIFIHSSQTHQAMPQKPDTPPPPPPGGLTVPDDKKPKKDKDKEKKPKS